MAYSPYPSPLSPDRRRQLWARLLIRLGIFVALLLFIFVFGKSLLGLLMPFLLAILVTWLTEPLLLFLRRRCRIPRGAGTVLLILLLVAAIGAIFTAIILRVTDEITMLANNWSQVWDAFQTAYLQVSGDLEKWVAYLPQETQETVWNLSNRFLTWLQEGVTTIMSNVVPKTTSAVIGISSFFLAFVFFLLAWYFTASDYPNLRRLMRERVPASLRRMGVQARGAFAAAFGGYVKAEVLVSLGVTAILIVSFLLLGQPYGILIAVGLGVLDFIPIVGSGTVMVPWAVILFILGDWRRGMALLLVWGIICLFRRILEPKIVGDQTGLHPLLSLLAIYIGMRIGGLLAMILAPVLLLMFRNLWQAGVFHATAHDLTMAARDMEAILHQGEREEETDGEESPPTAPSEPEPPAESPDFPKDVQKTGEES